MSGHIITFYSFKGGVGRSMAAANVAVLLARLGHKVLVVDWDLEAPGLHHYFKSYTDPGLFANKKGVIDLLWQASENASTEPGIAAQGWREVVITVVGEKMGAALDMILSGRRDPQYFGRVREFDLRSFYADQNGLQIVEELRRQWKEQYDFVLIDSRTGVTDYGGLCTIQLPDVLVLLFTANDQSLSGVIEVAEAARRVRKTAPVDRLALLCLPVPSPI